MSGCPRRCVLDGEIVIAGPDGLDFEALLLRIHPAASRVAMLAEQSPASFVAWDLLALDDQDLTATPQGERRALLEQALAGASSPVHLTPATQDRALAADWFERFEGAGLDGVVAKRLDAPYQPGKRAMVKVKHQRTADCVVAGFRWHKLGEPVVGIAAARPVRRRRGCSTTWVSPRASRWTGGGSWRTSSRPCVSTRCVDHPWAGWAEWAEEMAASGKRVPGATSRWNAGRDLSWEPLRPERVCEVAYDHLQGRRFRHATTFRHWRPDRRPEDCRYDQLEATSPFELARVFGA